MVRAAFWARVLLRSAVSVCDTPKAVPVKRSVARPGSRVAVIFVSSRGMGVMEGAGMLKINDLLELSAEEDLLDP